MICQWFRAEIHWGLRFVRQIAQGDGGTLRKDLSQLNPDGMIPDQLSLLLVEDNPADVYLVREAMRREGLRVHWDIADDGEWAIRKIDELDSNASTPCPDLLLLDVNVPRKTGDEVLERIRQSPRLARTPVVIISSAESPADRDRLMKLGATEYFRKPCDLQEFMTLGRLVREVYERARLNRPAL